MAKKAAPRRKKAAAGSVGLAPADTRPGSNDQLARLAREVDADGGRRSDDGASAVTRNRVIAFEPTRWTYARLSANTRLNPALPIVTVQVAPNTEIQVQKGAVTTLLPKGTVKDAR